VEQPAVLIAHSLGCQLAAAWAEHSQHTARVHAALLVAPPDTEREDTPPNLFNWRPIVRTRLPFDLIPAWADLRAQPLDEQLRVLSDPEARVPFVDAAVRAEYAAYTGVGAQARPPDFEGIRVYEQGLPPNPSVADVARGRGVHPAEAMIDLCVASHGEQLFIQPSLYPQDEGVLLRALRHPRAVMTFSDSGAHLSQIADSSIHTHLLGHWVRDRHEFTLEEAVRMITLAPALAWGFTDRGLLREDPSEADVVEALHRYLAQTPSRLLAISLADAVGDRRAQNQPGTDQEYPNWRVPLCDGSGAAVLLDDLPRVEFLRRLVAAIAR